MTALIFRLSLALLFALAAGPGAALACSSAAECDDGNDCTTDTCDLIDGCLHTPTVACTPRVDVPTPGHKLKLRIPLSNPSEAGTRILQTGGAINYSNLPVPLTAGDPVVAGGSLRFISSAINLDATYRLPATHWNYFPYFNPGGYKGYQYQDHLNLESPVGVIKIIQGKIMKLKAKGPSFQLTLGANPDPVGVILTLGTHRYCMSFGGERYQWKPDQIYWSKLAPAPSGCPCKVDPDCDDGDGGNGAEVCSAGFCQ